MFNGLFLMADEYADVSNLATTTLATFLGSVPRPKRKDGSSVPRLVIFDQFEEILTAYPDCWNRREDFFLQVREAISGSSMLRPGDILDPRSLTQELRRKKDPIARYLSEWLQRNGARRPADVADRHDLAAFTTGLNGIIKGGALYPGLPSEIRLKRTMRDLIENRARLTDPARLNRMLLEAAFPGNIATGVSGDPFLRVLFVMREDYVAGLEPYLGVLPEKLRARYRLERLSPDQALQAVIRPLEHASPRRAFAPGVADQLVKDLIEVEVQTPGTPDYRVVVPPAIAPFLRRVIGAASLRAFELVTTWLLARARPVQIDADVVGPDDVRAVAAAAWQTLSQSDFEIKDARLTGNGRLERSFSEFARELLEALSMNGGLPGRLLRLPAKALAAVARKSLRGRGRVMVHEQFVEPVAGGLSARFLLSWDFVDVGRVALLEGKLGQARENFARSLELREQCASESPNEFYKKHVALSLARLGELEQTAGNSEKALASYNKALAIAEALWPKDTADLSARRSLAEAYREYAQGSSAMGDLARARIYWNKVIDLFGVAPSPGRDNVPAPQASDDAARRRTEPEAKQGMADAYEWLVELGLRLGNTEEAEKLSARSASGVPLASSQPSTRGMLARPGPSGSPSTGPEASHFERVNSWKPGGSSTSRCAFSSDWPRLTVATPKHAPRSPAAMQHAGDFRLAAVTSGSHSNAITNP